jgi:predicted nucleic acid-binding protein
VKKTFKNSALDKFFDQLPNKIMLDASVMVRALLKEDQTAEVFIRRLFEQQEQGAVKLLSQPLLDLEVANALCYSAANLEDVSLIMEDYWALDLKQLTPTRKQVEQIVDLAIELKTTVYDTCYHVLALERGAVFVTADREYYKKAQELGSVELVAGS